MEFPQYRRLSNHKSFYRIDSNERFVEIQVIGTRCFSHDVQAKQYPEILRIKEMLKYQIDGLEQSSEEEFTSYLMRSFNV